MFDVSNIFENRKKTNMKKKIYSVVYQISIIHVLYILYILYFLYILYILYILYLGHEIGI